MGTIVAISINWFAAGVCFAIFLAMLIGKNYGMAALNGALWIFNMILGIVNIYRLIDAVQFVSESVK